MLANMFVTYDVHVHVTRDDTHVAGRDKHPQGGHGNENEKGILGDLLGRHSFCDNGHDCGHIVDRIRTRIVEKTELIKEEETCKQR